MPLETKFLQQLDRHSTKLVQIIRNKGGVTKERTGRILHSLDEVCTKLQLSQNESIMFDINLTGPFYGRYDRVVR